MASPARPPAPFVLLPVLDVRGGVAVHARGGDRSRYASLGPPKAVAATLRDAVGHPELYVAALDAITREADDFAWWPPLLEGGARPWIDAGFRQPRDFAAWRTGAARVVVGLETVAGPDEWQALVAALPPERCVLSFDLDGDRPRTACAAWRDWPAKRLLAHLLELAAEVCDPALGAVILLDLARVGSSEGAGAEPLLAWLRATRRDLDVYVGGGVRDRRDLRRLQALGATGALVGTALHTGAITRDDLAG